MVWYCNKHEKHSIDDMCPSCADEPTVESLSQLIENATMAASETQKSWKHRCYAIMEALGQDYGDPDWVMPDERKELDHLRALIKYLGIDANEPLPTQYDPKFGDDKLCKCGHPYYRHFDTYEDMRPVGCKYCWDPHCSKFEEPEISFSAEDIDLDHHT